MAEVTGQQERSSGREQTTPSAAEPGLPTAAPRVNPMLTLQQVVGNQAVQRMVRSKGLPPQVILGQQQTMGNQAVQRLLGTPWPARPGGAGPASAGGPGVVVQRDLLDGEAWRRSTADAPRDSLVEEVDSAVRAWAAVRDAGLEERAVALWVIKLKVTAWKVKGAARGLGKGQPTTSRLADQIDHLEQDVNARLQGIHADATGYHRQQQQRVHDWLAEASAQPGDDEFSRRLRNSVEWVAAGRITLRLATVVPDTDVRVPDKGSVAFLVTGLADAPAYEWRNRLSRTGIEVGNASDRGLAGWTVARTRTVTLNLSAGADGNLREWLYKTLRHEVQHIADRHTGGHRRHIERYRTEYRAYSYEGTAEIGGTSLTKPVGPAIVKQNLGEVGVREQKVPDIELTQRQLVVLKNVVAEYKEIRDQLNGARTAADNLDFFRAVANYTNPDQLGLNKYNSRRIDAFYGKLEQVKPGTADEQDAAVQAVIATGFGQSEAPLRPEDAAYIVGEGAELRVMLKAYLRGRAYHEVMTRLRRLAGAAGVEAV